METEVVARSEKHQEVGGQHGRKEKESLIVKIKLRQGFANGPFPSGVVFKVVLFFFFFHVFLPFSFKYIHTNKYFQRAS